MHDHVDLPDSVVALMEYVDEAGWTEQAELVVQVLMSSVHPDIEASVATLAFLPRALRADIAAFLQQVLVEGISEQQQQAIFLWTQCWTLASLDQ